MSFQGADPLGTAGGFDLYNLPQSPKDWRMAQGRVYFFFLLVNGQTVEINRENVEDVIRVLGLRGETLTGILIRLSGTVVDPSAFDLDFLEVVKPVDNITKVNFTIIPLSILTNMIADGQITLVKMASNSVDTPQIIDGNVDLASLAVDSVDSSKIVDATVAENDLALEYVIGKTPSYVQLSSFLNWPAGPGYTIAYGAPVAFFLYSGLQSFISTALDLTNAKQFRVSMLISSYGFAGSKMRIIGGINSSGYSLDLASSIGAGDCPLDSAGTAFLISGYALNKGAWTDVNPTLKTDHTTLRPATLGGNGGNTTIFYINVEFR